MWSKWLPWRFILRQAAKKHNVIDPFEILSQISKFAQPADVIAPSELLRAGFIFHTRGLINSQAIQHNLDWVWPYWVECQFNPKDKAFIPRAFSLTHVNLTHRNWTAIGLPDSKELPIVDPRGLLTPFWDGWSVDCWLIDQSGKAYVPSRLSEEMIRQELKIGENLSISTALQGQNIEFSTEAKVIRESGNHICLLKAQGLMPNGGWIVVSLRPYNPEGVSFIRSVEFLKNENLWRVDKKQHIHFQQKPDHNVFSYYRQGDVFSKICKQKFNDNDFHIDCHVGMATAAALFELKSNERREVCIEIPLEEDRKRIKEVGSRRKTISTWRDSLAGICSLKIPDNRTQFLYDAAIRTIILHSVDDIYPGPYTYKRFWFRDAVLILNAMLCVGMVERAERMLSRFPKRQTVTGYFRSQEGEWDSNGQVLWIINRFYEISGMPYDKKWRPVVEKGAHWIKDKRTSKSKDVLHAGLLPAGFSAEHFGPNDFYYWDDNWGVAGLKSAAKYFRQTGDKKHAAYVEEEAQDLMKSIAISLEKVEKRTQSKAIPTSPYRRMDSGAIGSIVSSYPLQISEPSDSKIMATVEYLFQNCLVDNGFFHDMSHSGVNPYLTLHLAQVLLRAGDSRCFDLIKAVADLATSTGQWPEAIHPITKGGCMGDGQHVWAAAEWVMMIRNCFVREEGDRIILCSGVSHDWLSAGKEISFGPAKTIFGEISVKLMIEQSKIFIKWIANWNAEAPVIEINIPGFKSQVCAHGESYVEIDTTSERINLC